MPTLVYGFVRSCGTVVGPIVCGAPASPEAAIQFRSCEMLPFLSAREPLGLPDDLPNRHHSGRSSANVYSQLILVPLIKPTYRLDLIPPKWAPDFYRKPAAEEEPLSLHLELNPVKPCFDQIPQTTHKNNSVCRMFSLNGVGVLSVHRFTARANVGFFTQQTHSSAGHRSHWASPHRPMKQTQQHNLQPLDTVGLASSPAYET